MRVYLSYMLILLCQVESLGNFYIIDDPLDLKYKAKYQYYTTSMMLDDIKKGKYDLETI